jgi:hypothetical protein
MLLLLLFFASLGFCQTATLSNRRTLTMKFIDSDFETSLPVQSVNETELLRVLAQNDGTSKPGCESLGCDGNNAQLPPDLDHRDYVENEEDAKCRTTFDFESLGDLVKHTNVGSVCADTSRVISCRIYTPQDLVDPKEIKITTLACLPGYACHQDGVRLTRFGDRKPTTHCVLNREISSWVIQRSHLGEKCSRKFSYSEIEAGQTAPVEFHLWSWNTASGLFEQLKWMYLKINGAYVRSASGISDWTFTWSGIKSSDILELCGTAKLNSPELELQAQGTIF